MTYWTLVVLLSCFIGRRPRNCNDIPDSCPSGVYKVYPKHTTGYNVYCEMKIDGGHWTVCYNNNIYVATATTEFFL